MKTKTKIVVLVEIAIVLCSVLLVALPGIAADQNTQKVSASEVTTASEDDYVLEIYGNANEDDTIDMGDVVYTKLAIFGKKSKTELCDAKYDGRINVLDVIQAKLIILGKEKELTIIDSDDRIVTVNKPINRIVTYSHQCTETLQLLDVEDKVVGVSDLFEGQGRRFPVISTKPSIGSGGAPDIEAILMVEPDIVIAYTFRPKHELLDDKLPEHIAVLRMDCTGPETMKEVTTKFGYLLDERDNADRYLEWHDRYVNEISERVSKIPGDERLRVFIDSGGTQSSRRVIGKHIYTGKDHPAHVLCMLAGGINIAADHSGYIETEWILDQNPEVILGRAMATGLIRPYEQDDNTLLKAYYDEIRGLPGFEENVAAVKNDRVYIITNDHAITPNYPSALAAIAKWFYPELFEDLDPKAIHQEYIDLKNIPFNVYEKGAFVYPPLE